MYPPKAARKKNQLMSGGDRQLSNYCLAFCSLRQLTRMHGDRYTE